MSWIGRWARFWSCLVPRWMRRAGAGFGVIAFGLVTDWLTLRCIVMQRPPVANLYETVIPLEARDVRLRPGMRCKVSIAVGGEAEK